MYLADESFQATSVVVRERPGDLLHGPGPIL